MRNCSPVKATEPINIGSVNDLVLDNTKPLTRPMLTQVYRYIASLGHNEFRRVSMSDEPSNPWTRFW